MSPALLYVSYALSIVKAIVERHGGTVSVTSQPGRTAFVMTLPHMPG